MRSAVAGYALSLDILQKIGEGVDELTGEEIGAGLSSGVGTLPYAS